MASTHQIVIIGASFAGLPTAQTLLKDVIPSLNTGKTYKVVLINPTDEFLWKIGAPRLIANPTALPVDKAILNFVPSFAQYGDQFEFIKGHATGIDHATRTVSWGASGTVHYDSLVIASGTHFKSNIWSTSGGSEKLRAELKEIHDNLSTAQSVLIAGGGPAGVETAGEFGESYGKNKEITILSGSDQLLSRLQNKNVGQDAQSRLEKMGVKTINDNVRVTAAKSEGGKHVLTLSNGETKTVDIYIDASGDQPNTSFVPAEWLTDKKQVKTDPNTLRLDVPGVTGVYAVGTVASYSNGHIMDVKLAYKPLTHTIQLDLQGAEPGPRTKNIYKKINGEMAFVPIGPTGGVGSAFGWRVPNFAVRMFKAKDFMIGDAPKVLTGNF